MPPFTIRTLGITKLIGALLVNVIISAVAPSTLHFRHLYLTATALLRQIGRLSVDYYFSHFFKWQLEFSPTCILVILSMLEEYNSWKFWHSSYLMFKIGIIDQIMRCLIVVILWQKSQEHKNCKCISNADLIGFWLVNSWTKKNNNQAKLNNSRGFYCIEVEYYYFFILELFLFLKLFLLFFMKLTYLIT